METEVGKTTIGRTEPEATAQRLEDQAMHKVQSLKEEAVDRGRRYLEQQKSTAAEYIKDFADALDSAASHLGNRQRTTASDYLKTASRELQRWSSSLRDHGVDSLAREVQNFAGRHPGMLLSGAAVAGFAVTRVFRSVREPVTEEYASRSRSGYSAEEPEFHTSAYRPPSAGPTTTAKELGPHS